MIENGDFQTNFNNSINSEENIINDSEKSDSDKSDHSDQPKKCSLIKILAISAIIFVVICIFLVVIIIVFVRHESTRPFTPEEIVGSIKCIYYINITNKEVELLSKEYNNKSNIDLTIDNKRVEFKKKYSFNKEGYHNITFYIDQNETLDYMYKDIISLISVELYSRQDINIISMNLMQIMI